MAVRPQFDTYALPHEIMDEMAAVALYKPYLFLCFALRMRDCVRDTLHALSFDHC
jgi:hypothetical protein